MPAVLPPQVPVAVVEYIKNNNYVPNEFRNDPELYTSLFIREICILNNYKVFKNTYQFKNNRIPDNNKYCYLFLYSPKVVKCATKDETNSIIELLPELSPSGISPVVIDFVNKYGNAPKKYKNLDIFNADTYITLLGVNDYGRFLHYKGYMVYCLGLPKINYDNKTDYRIVLYNGKEVKFATKDETNSIIKLFPEFSPSGIPPAVADFVNKYGNAPKKYKNLDIFNADTYIHGPFIKDKEQFKDFFLYSLGKDNSRYKKDRCKIVLHNENIVRCATKEEYEEITITTGKFIK